MATFFVACLLGVCLTAAVVVGVTLLFSERFRRTGGTTVAVDKGGPVCRMVEISGSDVKIYYNPAPEELEDAVPFIESPGSRPLDDGESDLETAVGNGCSDGVLRDALVTDMGVYPYRTRTYGKIYLLRESNITAYDVCTSCSVVDVGRSKGNPHGLMTEQFKIESNEKIGTRKRN